MSAMASSVLRLEYSAASRTGETLSTPTLKTIARLPLEFSLSLSKTQILPLYRAWDSGWQAVGEIFLQTPSACRVAILRLVSRRFSLTQTAPLRTDLIGD